MKNIYDIFVDECDGAICSNPSNTIGMGNPMLPTAEEPGTEPLIGKGKKYKKKKSNVKEGLLGDLDANMKLGDDLASIIEWYKSQYKYAKEDLDNADIRLLLERLSFEGKDTLVIDCKDIMNEAVDKLYIKDQIPNIKKIKIINSKSTSFKVFSFTNDLSNINFEVYEDNGRIYGPIVFHVKIRSGSNLQLGNIVCDKFSVNGPTLETISIGNNSVILEFALNMCNKLNTIYGPMRDAQTITVCKNFVKYQLSDKGIFPWGSNLTIINK